MVISFVLVSCDLGSDTKNDDDLPPLYFSTWDPTATPTYTPTPTLINKLGILWLQCHHIHMKDLGSR